MKNNEKSKKEVQKNSIRKAVDFQKFVKAILEQILKKFKPRKKNSSEISRENLKELQQQERRKKEKEKKNFNPNTSPLKKMLK